MAYLRLVWLVCLLWLWCCIPLPFRGVLRFVGIGMKPTFHVWLLTGMTALVALWAAWVALLGGWDAVNFWALVVYLVNHQHEMQQDRYAPFQVSILEVLRYTLFSTSFMTSAQIQQNFTLVCRAMYQCTSFPRFNTNRVLSKQLDSWKEASWSLHYSPQRQERAPKKVTVPLYDLQLMWWAQTPSRERPLSSTIKLMAGRMDICAFMSQQFPIFILSVTLVQVCMLYCSAP